jgi:hypothetical protein
MKMKKLALTKKQPLKRVWLGWGARARDLSTNLPEKNHYFVKNWEINAV